jgi:carbon starvation protein
MHALYLILPALGIFVIGYRYYSAFIAAKVMAFDDTRATPAHTKYDGHNYYPTSRWVLFGHHFAAITGSGPLIGPTPTGRRSRARRPRARRDHAR